MANTPAGAGDLFEPVQVKEGATVLTPDPDPVQYVGAPSTGPTYDVDGNLLTDGRWTYTWDGENRLISMTAPVWTQPAGGFLGGQTTLDAITLSFRYDGLSRRISKKVTITTNGVAESTMEGYLYDGWNPVMITKLDPAASSETVLTRKWSCLWRPDVGSSLYARSSWRTAGGVGGLAWLQTGSAQNLSTGGTSGAIVTGTGEVHIPMADHMGNIRHYVHFRPTISTGPYGSYTNLIVSQSANFEYDAFGREVRANGTTVAANPPPPADPITPPGLTAGTSYTDALPFHFSSKFTDPESGLNYYGYRFYDPKDGRWLNRDPMGVNFRTREFNAYAMVNNNSIGYRDYLGLYIDSAGNEQVGPPAPVPVPGQGHSSNGNCWRGACNDPAKKGEDPRTTPPGFDPFSKKTDEEQCADLMAGIIEKAGGQKPNEMGCCPKGFRLISPLIAVGVPDVDKNGATNDFHFKYSLGCSDDLWWEKYNRKPPAPCPRGDNPPKGNFPKYKNCGQICVKDGTDTDKIDPFPKGKTTLPPTPEK